MENSLTIFIIGIIYFILGLPLFLQKVKRNGFYGFRVEKTLSDDKYWYPVNKSAGMWFMVSGIIILCAALGLPYLGLEEISFFWIMIAVIVLGTLPPILIPYKLLKTIH